MHGKTQLRNSNFVRPWRAPIVALAIMLVVLPVWAQNPVPPTARAAAASPAFASKLHPANQSEMNQGPPAARAQVHRASPQDQVIYENGPANGTTDAWTINFGYIVSDTFTLSSASTVRGFDFYAWEVPGDMVGQVDWSITSGPNGGTVYGSGTAKTTDTFISTNQYGYNIDKITATGLNVSLNSSGTYWFNLQNASVPSGDPVYWDENSGKGCNSPGCPSQAVESAVGTIPSESFDIVGGNGPGCFQQNNHLQVLHSFTPQEGSSYGLVEGLFGAFYATSSSGGDHGQGLAYELSAKQNWVPTPIYSFTGGYNGYGPSPLIADQNGFLYGTASGGIQNCGTDGTKYCGLIFRIRPAPVACRTSICSWSEEVLYRSTGNNDPMPSGGLFLDQAGNLYGGCASGQYGGLCELTPSNGGWSDKLLYSFPGSGYGLLLAGIDGNFYGATRNGGDFGAGSVFQLIPSGDDWTLNTIYSFDPQSDGCCPGHLFQNVRGDLYGDLFNYYYYSQSIFELSPSNGQWVFSVVWQTQDEEQFVILAMDEERQYSPGGIVVGGGCRGSGCSAPADPAGSVYYYGYFDTHRLDGYLGFGGNSYFNASGLVIGGGGQAMWGTTWDCGSYNNGTLWYWHY